jgi:hypothetical protein
MNDQNEPSENLEPNETDSPVDEVTGAADEAMELPEIVEATDIADDEIVEAISGDEAPVDATTQAAATDVPGVEVPTADTAAPTDKPKRRVGRLAAVAAVAALLGVAGGAGAMALLGDGGHGHGGRGDHHQMEADGGDHDGGHHGGAQGQD